jgi:hypothetical protein
MHKPIESSNGRGIGVRRNDDAIDGEGSQAITSGIHQAPFAHKSARFGLLRLIGRFAMSELGAQVMQTSRQLSRSHVFFLELTYHSKGCFRKNQIGQKTASVGSQLVCQTLCDLAL